jgi:hypothetical protein
MNFTEEQKAIIEAPLNQNINVVATAGSGKTTVMVSRIINMIKERSVNPKSIALFTYNKSLGIDMSNKLRKLEINPEDLFWCGTLHAFAYQTTRDYQDLQPWINRFENVTTQYNARGFPIGYDTQNNLKYIIFDEYQDADPDIAGVMKILAKDRHLMIVGDTRQQLYKYRGADVNHLRSIKDNFIELTLSQTFRCNKNICKLLNRIWANEDVPATHAIIRSQIDGPRPQLYRSRGSAMNNPSITNEIINLVKKYKEGSIAIISPTINSDTSRRFLNDVHSNIYDKCGISFKFAEDNVKDSNYVITSVHGSKGLEYDTVILLNTIDNKYYYNFPSIEAQCKFFVACSRAKQNLILFEHNYHYSNGSLKWITDNEDLFDKPDDKIWNAPTRQRTGDIGGPMERTCIDYIKGFTNEQRRNLLSKYELPEIVETETGLESHVGDPCLNGQLIELLYATKLKFDINFEFRPFITSNEWSTILKQKEIPSSVMDKIKRVFPYEDIDVKRKVEGGRARIVIMFIDKIKLFNAWRPVISESMVETREITENHIVSDFMCDEYYKNIKKAHKMRNNVLISKTCNKNYIENIWWLLRFQRLMDMSLTGFQLPDLSNDEVEKALNYIENSTILKEKKITEYHSHYRNEVPAEIETWVRGEIDFDSPDGFVELKCIQNNELEEAWLQVMVYNQIAGMKYQNVYVYNAITGVLYQRKLKSAK